MTDFQVGDRVSVEGIVEQVGAGDCKVRLNSPSSAAKVWFYNINVTLVERPKRKPRVGSVWEHNYIGKKAWIVGQRAGADLFVPLDGLGAALLRSQTNFDTHPQDWREVPVEELEAEANT